MYKQCQPYFDKPLDVIMALEDELRRNTLEYLVRELIDDGNREVLLAALAERAEERDDQPLDRADFEDDDDEYLTELLDRSTDDGLGEVITLARAGASPA